MSKLYIPVLLGTTRAQRRSGNVAGLVRAVGKTFENVETEVIDPVHFNFPGDGNDIKAKDPAYSAITERADGFFIVVPEYNHSFPGSLKRMLDSELSNYIHKPVAFAGVSASAWGGVRAIEQLVGVVRELGLVSTFKDMQFPQVQNLFNDQGVLQDESYRDYVAKSWIELIWMATVLKNGRNDVPSEYHSKA